MTPTNCPNCGAPITGPKCEYCGTVFNYDMAPTFGMTEQEAVDDLFSVFSTKTRVGEQLIDIFGCMPGITPNERRAAVGLAPIEKGRNQ